LGDSLVDKIEWKTIENWIHLDCNPLTGLCSLAGFEYERKKIDLENSLVVQGLITLTDAKEEDGGFHCVPGFHKYTKLWVESLKSSSVGSENVQVSQDDKLIHDNIQKIPMRQGSVLIWNTLLLHGNYPNNSPNFRAVQYCRMAAHSYFRPLITDPDCYGDIEVSPLGKKLFGLEEWVDVEPETTNCSIT